jgi:G8 domain-containing protein
MKTTMHHRFATFGILALGLALPPAGAAAAAGADSPPPLIRSARSGRWSDAGTWQGGKIPGGGDGVQIRAEDRVVYDVCGNETLRSIHVAGTLSFATDRDTRLDVGLIRVQRCAEASENGFDCDAAMPDAGSAPARATLEIGSPEHPVDARCSALVRLVYVDGMDRDSCPAIVCCGGRMEFHGAPMSRTWVKLGATAKVGDRTVTLSEPVTGWRIGDRVVVTATERDRGRPAVVPADYGADAPATSAVSDEPLTEERIVRAIDGTTLTLDRPLSHHHLGDGAYRGEVANLSRNVVVESADPDGVRGHTMYHRGSAGSIGYAEFRHLGKRGVLGRYSLHFHRVRDSMRGSSVVGASIWDSDNRWLTVHGTDYLVVRDCVGYRSVGHGFYVEDGTEAYNVFDRNLAIQAFAASPLPDQALPFDDNGGAGFWWANSLNTFTRNVACDCDGYGFRFEASPVGGFDLRLPVRQPDGTEAKVDVRTLPFVRFEDNEAHSEPYGLNLGEEGSDRPGREDRHSGVGPDVRHPFVVRNTKIWNARWAIRPETPSLVVDGLDVYACVYGFYRAKFVHHAYDRVSLSAVGLTEAFSQGVASVGLSFPNSGMSAFQTVGAALTAEEIDRFRPILGAGRVEMSPAEAERLVRGSYPSGGLVGGRALPQILEDSLAAKGSGVACGPLRSPGFPKPLDPVDDLPPVTVIVSVEPVGEGRWTVHGTTSDDGGVKRVRVNGRDAKATAPNFAEWEVTLASTSPGTWKVTAVAEDAAGNVEKTPHELVVPVAY